MREMKKRRQAGALQVSAVRFTDYSSIVVMIPAVNCWAIINRPSWVGAATNKIVGSLAKGLSHEASRH
jgi:hypothetical protein